MRYSRDSRPSGWMVAPATILLLVGMLGSPTAVWAEGGMVRGRIIEGTTGEPIPNQVVKITEFDLPEIKTVFRLINNMLEEPPPEIMTRETTTSAEGHFDFDSLKEGRFYYIWTPWSFDHKPDSRGIYYESRAGYVFLCEGEPERDLGNLEAFHFQKIVFRIRGTVRSEAFSPGDLYVRVCMEVPNRPGYQEFLRAVNEDGSFQLELEGVKGIEIRVSAGALTPRVKTRIAELVENEAPALAEGPLQSQLLMIKRPPYDGTGKRFVLDSENPDIVCELEVPDYKPIRGQIIFPEGWRPQDGTDRVEVRLMSEPVNPFPEVCFWSGFVDEEGRFGTEPMPARDYWLLVSRGDNFDVHEVGANELSEPLQFKLSERLQQAIETTPVNVVIERRVPENLDREEWKKQLIDKDCKKFVMVAIPLDSGIPEEWFDRFETPLHVRNWGYVMPHGVMWGHPIYRILLADERTATIEYPKPLQVGKKYRFMFYIGQNDEELGTFLQGQHKEMTVQQGGEPIHWLVRPTPQELYNQLHEKACRYFLPN